MDVSPYHDPRGLQHFHGAPLPYTYTAVNVIGGKATFKMNTGFYVGIVLWLCCFTRSTSCGLTRAIDQSSCRSQNVALRAKVEAQEAT